MPDAVRHPGRSEAELGPVSARHLVVMGVSGTGKTTVGQELAARLGRAYLEGDDAHPPANVALMAAGIPLTDADRAPWLRELMRRMEAVGERGSVVTCSALRRSYRELLATVDGGCFFVHLDVPRQEIERRMTARTGHFMPVGLLDSQLADLEPLEPGEHGVVVDGARPVEQIVDATLDLLRQS